MNKRIVKKFKKRSINALIKFSNKENKPNLPFVSDKNQSTLMHARGVSDEIKVSLKHQFHETQNHRASKYILCFCSSVPNISRQQLFPKLT